MRIAIGSDHRGVDLKQRAIKLITETGHTYQDFGTYNTEPVDYPDIAQKVSQIVEFVALAMLAWVNKISHYNVLWLDIPMD